MTDEEQVELISRLGSEHEGSSHPGLAAGRLRLHLAIHAVVETQVVEGKPRETRLTLERLVEEGLDRHEAVHAIGHVVSEEMLSVLAGGTTYDERRYTERLHALSAVEWRQGKIPGE